MASHKYEEIKYNIGFNVDNQSLQDVKKQLQEIQTMTTKQYQAINPNASKDSHAAMQELKAIKQEALQVEAALEKAYNPNLGVTNLQKFKTELKGIKLGNLYQDFNKLGATGSTAFRSLSTGILTTNTYLKQSNKLIDDMARSLKNTIKWGISSSVFNSLTGSLQKAWSYAKNLDKSLNDIRIVSDKSADDMTRFAIQANKAAQALGASTLDYTKGALIYYQQGLSDEEVIKRTDITVKMSNVLGRSAQEVSDYMTAIWNNFYDGSQSLEYFADVLTKLGAETASSAEEISQGLEKFAAVSKTVGLSYEYAAAALTTITDRTRQSADVVGTALKTLFARIQDLEIGEEGSVSIGKYAEALAKFDINVLDGQGNLKKMNDILDEMGSKWSTMSEAQKVGLAQNVAGVRQYTQLMSLMENWDFFKENVLSAETATGSLQKQQDIYLDSIEAHLNQMTAASERLKNSLIDPKGVNSLVDGLTKIISLFANFTESVGGGRNLLLMLGSIGSQVFGTQIATGIATTINNLRSANNEAQQFKSEWDLINEQLENPDISKDPIMQVILNMRKDLQEVKPYMSDEQIEIANKQIQKVEEMHREATEKIEEYWERLRRAEQWDPNAYRNAQEKVYKNAQPPKNPKEMDGTELTEFWGQLDNSRAVLDETATSMNANFDEAKQKLQSIVELYEKVTRGDSQDFKKDTEELKEGLGELEKVLVKITTTNKKVFTTADIKTVKDYIVEIRKNINEPWYNKKTRELKDHLYGAKSNLENVQNAVNNADNSVKKFTKSIEESYKKYDKAKDIVTTNQDIKDSAEKMYKPFSDSLEIFRQIGDIKAFTNLAAGLGQFASALQSLHNIGKIFNNEDLSTGEKILQITMALGTGLGMLGNSLKLVRDNWSSVWTVMKKVSASYLVNAEMTKKQTAENLAEAGSEVVQEKVKKKKNQASQKELITNGLLTASNISVTTTIWGMVKAIGALLIEIAPFVLIGAAVAGTIALIVTAANAHNERMKELNETYKALNEDYEKSRQELDDIKKVFENYSTAIDTLESLNKGSIEWYESLSKVNAQAMEILKTYPQLAKISNLFTRDEDNILRINEEVLDQYIEQMQKVVNTKQMAAVVTGAQITQEKKNDLDIKYANAIKTPLLQQEDYYVLRETSHGNSEESKAKQEKADQIFGTVQKEMDTFKSHINDFVDLTDEEYAAKLTEIGIMEEHQSVFIDYKDSVKELATVTDEAAAQMENAAAAIAAIVFEGRDDKTGAGQSLYAKKFAETNKQKKEKWERSLTGSGINIWSGKDNDKAKAALEALNKAQGTNWDFDSNAVRGSDSNRSLAFRDEEGNEKVLSASQIASIIAASETQEELDVDAIVKEAQTLIQEQAKNLGGDEELADIILDKARVDYKDLSQEQVEAIRKAYNTKGEDGKSILAISDEEAQSLGYKNADEYLKGIEKKLLSYKPEDNEKYLANEAKGIIQQGAKELDVDEDAIEIYVDGLQRINKHLRENDKLAAKTAVDTFKFAKGIEALNKAYDDNKKTLDTWAKSNKTAAELGTDTSEAVGKIKDALKQTYDVDFDEKTIKNNFDTIKKAMKGEAAALNKMELLSADQYLVDIGVDTTDAYNNIDGLRDSLKELANADLEVGAEFNDQQALQDLNSFFQATKMTKDQAQAYLNKLGYEGEIEMTKVPGDKIHSHTTSYVKDKDGNIIQQTETDSDTESEIEVAQLKSKDDKTIKPLQVIRDSKSNGNVVKNNNKNKTKSGGSSSKKQKKPKWEKDELDRYHIINTQIEKVENALKKLQKQEEKTLGDKLLQNLNKQWNLLNTQVNNYKEKLKIAQGEYNELRNKLTKKGVTFKDDGTVDNYFAVLKQQEKEYKKIFDWYYGLSAAQQEKDANKDKLEAAQKAYEEFKKEIDRIDTLASSEIPNIVQAIHDTIDEEIQTNIKAFSLEVELSLDLKEARQAWNNFKEQIVNGLRDEDIFGNAQLASKNLGTLLTTNSEGAFSGDLVNQVGHVNEIMQQIALQKDNLSNVYGDNTKAALDDLKKWLDEATNSYEQVVEYQKQIHQSYLDMLDEAKEKLDEQIEEYERITSLLEHDKRLVELTYGEKAYAILDKYYKLQKQNNKDELKTLKAQQDSYKARMEAAEQAMKDAKIARDAEVEGTDAWKQRQKDYLETVEIFDKTKEQWEESVDKGNEKLEESIETGKESLENLINLLTLTLEQDLTGKTGGLGYAEEEWDLINRNADQYLDTINRLQGENQLESKYLESIEKATNPTIQKKIKDIMESEMKALREKDKLSQYDLDRANKRYQIMLAQIALEEAQQNKNKMRLRRDSQGNYRYQYVADEDATKKAKEELSNLYADLYNFDKERYKTTLSDIEATTKEFNEKLKELSQISDPDEKLEREKLLREEYEELFTAIKEQAETARVNLTDSAFDDLSLLQEKSKDEFLAMTEEETNALMTDLVPAWGSVYQAIVENLDPLNYVNDAINAQKEAYEATNGEIDEYLILMGRSKEEIGEVLDENGQALDKNILKTQEFIEANEGLIETYETNLLKLEDLIKNTDDLIKRYLTETEAINKLAEAYTEWDSSMQDALDTYDNYSQNPTLVTDPKESDFNETPEGNGEAYNPITEQTQENSNQSSTTTTTNNKTITDKISRSTKLSKGEKKKLQQFLKDMGWYTDKIDGVWGKNSKAALKKFQGKVGTTKDGTWGPKTYDAAKAKGYDTGGYTGTWDNTGRLAFLHQKELVLNAQDTENILNTVAIMRNLMASMNQDILSRLAGVSAGTVTNLSGGNAGLEQNVHIDANFPNATNSNEIEEALRNLVNVASQRITK